MLGGPILEINLDKIEDNTRRVVQKCHEQGINVVGVTKGFGAIPQIVTALIAGNIDGLTDSRLENIEALRKNGFDQEITLLRIPRLSRADQVVRLANVSVNSELLVLGALASAAVGNKLIHHVILMVDVGDLREGVMPEMAVDTAKHICGLKGLQFIGVGTNMGCFGGILPTQDNLGMLVSLSREIEDKVGVEMQVVSGGGTSSLLLVENRNMPQGVNQVRIGEGILLGTDTTNNRHIPWLHRDAFRLKAEIIELKEKPSIPIGDAGLDAFGNQPQFEDRGLRLRAIIAIGRQDVPLEGLSPVDPNMTILGASSDHMILDVADVKRPLSVGSTIEFDLTYTGMLLLCNSWYVKKLFVGGRQ